MDVKLELEQMTDTKSLFQASDENFRECILHSIRLLTMGLASRSHSGSDHDENTYSLELIPHLLHIWSGDGIHILNDLFFAHCSRLLNS